MHQHSWRGLTLLRKSRIFQPEDLCYLSCNRQPVRRQCTLRKLSEVDHRITILLPGPAGMGDDDWGLSMEEMDSLERNAVQELAARKLASPSKSQPELLGRLGAQKPPPSPLGRRPIRVKVFVDGHGKVAVEAPYNQKLLAAYKSVNGHEWDPGRRLWLFPEHHLQDVLGAVTGVPELVVDVQAVPPLVLPMSASHFTPSSSVHGLSPQSSPAMSQDRPTSAPCTPSKDVVVYIYLIDENHIAARSPYNQNVKEACQSVPGRVWNNEEKLWVFPRAHIADLLRALQLPGVQAKVEPSLSGETESAPTVNMTATEPLAFTSVKHPIKLFLHNSGLIAVKCQPSSRVIAALKSIPKAFWSHRETLWLFPSRFLHEAEQKLAACDDISCVTDSLDPLVRRALDSQSNVPDITDYYRNIPPRLESKLLPFQREGIRFGLQHGGRVLIADEMGLGKTMQAIALAACVREAWPVLVIVPSSLRIHWATMIKTWLGLRGDDITVVLSQGDSTRGGFTTKHSGKSIPLELTGLFNIISYDMVSKLTSEHSFKVIIADESHYMKNAQAKRTNACVPLIQKSLYAFLLSGTPALSRPVELFKQLEALQPSVYCNVHEYGKRYCQGSFFGLYQGSSNHEELHALLKSTIMIRRLKAEVLSELPEKVREQVYLSLDMKNAKQLRALLNELKRLREAIQCSMDDRIEQLKREEKVLINKIYVESAVAKIPAVQDYLSTVIEANCKFLVFAHHHSMMDGIEDHFKKKKVEYIRIDGETTPGARQSLVTRFQENENVRAAVLSIRAAGVGLTLTAASTVIFAEMSWTPGDIVQAEDRAHRIGQSSSVSVYYLHAQETIDDFIWESIHRKLENLGQVLNGREEKMQVASPLQQRQKSLDNYLRPCSRNLSELYEKEEAGPSSTMNKTSQMESEHQTKRLKLSD